MVGYTTLLQGRKERTPLVQRICFVCLGNIVRSPLAESMFAFHADQAGVGEYYEVDSAGTSAWHVGEPPDPRMRGVAKRHGLTYDGRSRQFQAADLDRFDWIIAMDQENARDLKVIALHSDQSEKILLMRSFDFLAEGELGVPDPYYGGMEGFERVYSIVERSTRGLLEYLEKMRLRGGKQR